MDYIRSECGDTMKKTWCILLVAMFMAGCSHQVQVAECGLPLEVPVEIMEAIWTVGDIVFSKDGGTLAAEGELDERPFYAWGPDVYPTGHLFLVFTGEDELGGLYVMEGIEYDLTPVEFIFFALEKPDYEFRRYMEMVY